MGVLQKKKMTRLRDVLGRRPPVDVAARVAVAHPVKLPDQRHQPVPRAGVAGADGLHVQVGELRLPADLLRGGAGDDAQLPLRQGERGSTSSHDW